MTTEDLESPLVSSNDLVVFEIISHCIGKSQSPKQKMSVSRVNKRRFTCDLSCGLKDEIRIGMESTRQRKSDIK